MGIFSVFRRKSKVAAEELAGETEAIAPTAEPTPEGETGEPQVGEPAEGAAVRSAGEVEIPRQQSAAAAADNEAGEGVRK